MKKCKSGKFSWGSCMTTAQRHKDEMISEWGGDVSVRLTAVAIEPEANESCENIIKLKYDQL